jgi:hypothetical protein
MSDKKKTNSELLKLICETEGYDTVDQLCDSIMYTDTHPGICKSCHFCVLSVEPDCWQGVCEECNENKVVSATELLISEGF